MDKRTCSQKCRSALNRRERKQSRLEVDEENDEQLYRNLETGSVSTGPMSVHVPMRHLLRMTREIEARFARKASPLREDPIELFFEVLCATGQKRLMRGLFNFTADRTGFIGLVAALDQPKSVSVD